MFNSKTFNSGLYNNTTLYFATIVVNSISDIQAKANYYADGSVNMQGLSDIQSNVVRQRFISAVMDSLSSVQANPLRIRYGTAEMFGMSDIVAEAMKILYATINMQGDGDVSARGVAASFIIDSNNILWPLGVHILRDGKEDLMPRTREFTEQIPGKHGELYFGSKFGPRILELHVVTDEGLSQEQINLLRRKIPQYLNPTNGIKTLVFLEDIEKVYNVTYSGQITPEMYPRWFDFTIPFKMPDPFIYSTFENEHIGSGTLINEGNVETELIIEIQGPVTDPSVTIGGDTLTYTGILSSADVVTIDTGKMTVKFNSENALANYSGGFPKLLPGETEVTAGNNVIFKWRHKWI